MSGTLKHKKLTGIANDDSPVGGATWDAEHVFANGSNTQVLVRDSTQSDGATWSSARLHTYADAASAGPNLFVGVLAGNFTLGPGGGSSLFGSYNTGLGYGVLAANTTGYENTALGYLNLNANTTGYCNTAVGQGVLDNNTIGFDNTAVGQNSLHLNVDGTQNTAVGVDALVLNTSGGGNVAVGQTTLAANLTGSFNTAVGRAALTLSTASYNVAVGYFALTATLGGAINTAIGYNVMAANTSGDNNTAVGGHALVANIGGGGNVAIGYRTLFTASSGSFNVALGYEAGYYETGSNKLFIDNTTRASEADGRAKALVYGIFDAATANQYLTLNGHLIARETVQLLTMGAFAASDKYVVIDSSGNLHVSALGPAS